MQCLSLLVSFEVICFVHSETSLERDPYEPIESKIFRFHFVVAVPINVYQSRERDSSQPTRYALEIIQHYLIYPFHFNTTDCTIGPFIEFIHA